MRKGSIGLYGQVLIFLMISMVVIFVYSLPWVEKAFKIKSEANLFFEVNDQTGKMKPILNTKLSDLSYHDIFVCIIARIDDCEHDDVEIDKVIRDMDTEIILYSDDGEKTSFGERPGDLMYTQIPLPNGKRGEIAFVIDAMVEKTSTKRMATEYDRTFGSCESEGSSYLSNRLTLTNFMGKTVYVHRLARDDFVAVNDDIKKCKEAQDYEIETLGTYACRRNINNPSVMSLHAYGLALDINPSENPNCPKDSVCGNRNICITDIPVCIVEAFKKHNFIWGCDFKSVKDSMHFEWVPPTRDKLMEFLAQNKELETKEGDELEEQ